MLNVRWSLMRARRRRGGPLSDAQSVNEAARWLCRAQDSGDDDGIPAYFDAKKTVWAASYPETTGYIIPTFYRLAAWSGNGEFRQRAERMAHWETAAQLPEGAVRAGLIDAAEARPTVFNTGQVIFGWLAAWKAHGNERFLQSLIRAAEWLLAAQDKDGAWRKFGSPFTTHAVNTYNTRVAFSLALAGDALADPRYTEAAKANVRWALSQACDNGWLENNDLEDNERPLTHTIAYAIRGILEVGLCTGEQNFVSAAEKMARAVASAQRPDGALPGRLDRNWKAAANWSCLTGNAQMAIIWLRLFQHRGDRHWRDSAEHAIRFVQQTQDCTSGNPDIRGAIAGSTPFRAPYMRYRYPNWAAKFFIDAVLLLGSTDQATDA